MSSYSASPKPRRGGFKRTDTLLRGQIRDVSATRGFAQSRILTHWAEIAGADTAAMSRPVEVSYGRGGMGATLVLLTTGANGPILEMQKDKIREKVNAVYGYNAISRIRVTQTAPTGFAEGQVEFTPAPKPDAPRTPSKTELAAASEKIGPVADDGLRQALERLGANIMSRMKR